MDWAYIHMPISGVSMFWPGLGVLGFGVGVIGGFFGVGGGWLVTPGLNILGFPISFAIGTDLAQMSAGSIVSTMRHAKFGNVDYRLGTIMIAGTLGGVEIGARFVMYLEHLGIVGGVIRYCYLVLLTLIAWTVFTDISRQRKQCVVVATEETAVGIDWYKSLHRINIPPMIHFKTAGIHCSVWLPIFISLFIGLISGTLGIGGGLIVLPAFIYLLGCPTHVAVGTSLYGVMFSGLYGTFTYTLKGRTELLAALIMVLGAAVGAQIGTIATKYIQGLAIRYAFGLSVMGVFASIFLKQFASRFHGHERLFLNASTVIIFGLVILLCTYITVKMVQGAGKELRTGKDKTMGKA
ncbi:MAG: sulfite exporter TauE/SafE family protein [Deltaproteobacteria bacterium]|nr:sulfite exporter TauE/SafE family protein [Deltaproteobacteria bacterium]MCL5276986.1 sulfite exporter TauE/SafE family protein [Deltaproteobacteria bacterium]